MHAIQNDLLFDNECLKSIALNSFIRRGGEAPAQFFLAHE